MRTAAQCGILQAPGIECVIDGSYRAFSRVLLKAVPRKRSPLLELVKPSIRATTAYQNYLMKRSCLFHDIKGTL